ncbi:uncharacterized protein LOC120778773 [Bactrocera tryoni]|uniref:uncharacterized protein LOC120778773 n=1 Tax=Bactrocera tryoni TaxID=59916 RepID=UPI001A968E71|nr:uncharacterized protein LOC120778773 [Bactrocera tryoni]
MGLSSRSLTKLLLSAFLTLTRITPAETDERQKRMEYRLNQDVLENLFGVIRLKGGLHDHPDRKEFKYRLRSYILGHNERPITDEGNIEVDNTPDFEGNYLSLTGNIFQRVSVDLNSADPIEKNYDLKILNNDGLENFSATNLVKITPKLVPIQKIVRLILGWITYLKEDFQNQQIHMLMEHMRALQAVFDALNGTDLHICTYNSVHN